MDFPEQMRVSFAQPGSGDLPPGEGSLRGELDQYSVSASYLPGCRTDTGDAASLRGVLRMSYKQCSRISDSCVVGLHWTPLSHSLRGMFLRGSAQIMSPLGAH